MISRKRDRADANVQQHRPVIVGSGFRRGDMRNLDISDTRAKLKLYTDTGLLSGSEGAPIPRLGNDKD